MPGTNAGTGHPLTFRCAVCKVGRDYRSDSWRGTNWEATGEVRGDLDAVHRAVRVSRHTKARYRCLDCGHVGWSGHYTVLEAARSRR
jgi:hypothetical protein